MGFKCALRTLRTPNDNALYTRSSPADVELGKTRWLALSLGDSTHSPRGLCTVSNVANTRILSKSKIWILLASTTTRRCRFMRTANTDDSKLSSQMDDAVFVFHSRTVRCENAGCQEGRKEFGGSNHANHARTSRAHTGVARTRSPPPTSATKLVQNNISTMPMPPTASLWDLANGEQL